MKKSLLLFASAVVLASFNMVDAFRIDQFVPYFSSSNFSSWQKRGVDRWNTTSSDDLIMYSMVGMTLAAVGGLYIYNRTSDDELLNQAQIANAVAMRYALLTPELLESMLHQKNVVNVTNQGGLQSNTEYNLYYLAQQLQLSLEQVYDVVTKDFELLDKVYRALWWRSFKVKALYVDSEIRIEYKKIARAYKLVKLVNKYVQKHEDFYVGMKVYAAYQTLTTSTQEVSAVIQGMYMGVSAYPLHDFVRELQQNVEWAKKRQSRTHKCTQLYPVLQSYLPKIISWAGILYAYIVATPAYIQEEAIKAQNEQLAMQKRMAQAQEDQAWAAHRQASASHSQAGAMWTSALKK